MTVRDKPTLKSYFESGKVPIESNHIDLIDSIPYVGDGGAMDLKLDRLTCAMGTAFPTGAQRRTGELFYRTDIGLLCFWSGSLWLSIQHFEMRLDWNSLSGTDQFVRTVGMFNRTYPPYIGRVQVYGVFAAPQDANNLWYIVPRLCNAANTSTTDIGTYYTSTVTPGVGSILTFSITTRTHATNYHLLDIFFGKTGSPGALTLGHLYVTYRLIIPTT